MRTALLLVAAALVACQSRQPYSEDQRWLLAALDSAYGPAGPDVETVFEQEPSVAIEGLTYVWGVRQDSTIVDGGTWPLLAGFRGDRRQVLASVSDWNQIVGEFESSIGTEDLQQVCAEAIRYAGPGQSYLTPPFIVLDPDEAQRLLESRRADLIGREVIEEAIQPPVLLQDRSIQMWALESGRVVRYACAIAHSKLKLDELEVVEGVGFRERSP